MAFVTDVVQGFWLALRGVGFLGQHRTLWRWAVWPAVINFLVFGAAFALFLIYYKPLYDFATGFFSPPAPAVWYAWLWVAPLRALAWSIGILMVAAVLAILYCAFLLLGTTIAAPFLAILAQRVEAIETGQIRQDATSLFGALRVFGTTVVDELCKLAFFVGVQLVLVLLGLIPFLSPLMILAAALFTMLFLPLEYASFAMDNRQLRFVERRTLIWQHRWLMFGFGAAAFVTLLVPFLNFICLPALVAGGTLLFLHIETLPTPPSRR